MIAVVGPSHLQHACLPNGFAAPIPHCVSRIAACVGDDVSCLSELGRLVRGGGTGDEGGSSDSAAGAQQIISGLQRTVDTIQALALGAVDVDTGDASDTGSGEGAVDSQSARHGKGPSPVYVCQLLPLCGTQPWMQPVNGWIATVNKLLHERLQGATVLRVAIPAEAPYYEPNGISLSSLGMEQLVSQLNALVPELAERARREAMQAEAEAKAAQEEAIAAVAAAQAAQKALLSSKINFSRAMAETAAVAKVAAAQAAEEARVAAIEYQYWSQEVAAARARAATEILQASYRARLARASGVAHAPTVGAAAAAAAARAKVRGASLAQSQQGHQERFGLWTRKRCWAATVLQAFVRKHMLSAMCMPCDTSESVAEAMATSACNRCGIVGHWARQCTTRWWHNDPSIECEAKLRLRAVREQRVDEDGVVRTRTVIDVRLFVGPVPIERPTRLRLHVSPEGHVVAELEARMSRESRDAAAGGKSRFCRFFERFGNCSRGEACGYAHSPAELNPEARAEYYERVDRMSQAAPQQQLLLPDGREPLRLDDLFGHYKTRLCEAFLRDGRCQLGSACSFAHGEDELQKKPVGGPSERDLFRAEQMSRNRLCRYWQSTGSCPNGAACLFSHGTEQLAKRQAARFLGGGESGGGTSGADGGGEGSSGGLVCLCLKPFSGCRLWPIATTGTHIVRVGQTSGPSISVTTTMLGSLSQFCATFYHANSWEASVKLCLHWPTDASGSMKAHPSDVSADLREKARKCSKNQVAVIGRLVHASGALQTAANGPASPRAFPPLVTTPVPARARTAARGSADSAGGCSECTATVKLVVDGAGVDGSACVRAVLSLAATPACADAAGDCTSLGAPVAAEEEEEYESLYVARYANCYRGNTDVNRHAEEFLFEDTQIMGLIRSCKPSDGLRLVLYMTYQPCHHSGGRVPREALNRPGYAGSAPQHPTTCSERMKQFYLRELKPRGVALELVLADVYKATWDEGLHPSEVERRVYGTKAESARDGMRMLHNEGVTMRSMSKGDWGFLISLSDAEVRQAYAHRGKEGSPFTRLHVGLRQMMDEYLAGYIQSVWDEESPPEPIKMLNR